MGEEPSEELLERLRNSLHIPLYKFHEPQSLVDDTPCMTYKQAMEYDNTYVQNNSYAPQTKTGKDPEVKSRTIDIASVSGPIDVEQILAAKGRLKLPEPKQTKVYKRKTSPFDCPQCKNVSLEFDTSSTLKVFECPLDKTHCYYYCQEHDQLLLIENRFYLSQLFVKCKEFYTYGECMCEFPHDSKTAVGYLKSKERLS